MGDGRLSGVLAPPASSAPIAASCFCAAGFFDTNYDSLLLRGGLPRNAGLQRYTTRASSGPPTPAALAPQASSHLPPLAAFAPRDSSHLPPQLLLRRGLLEWAALSTNVPMDGGGLGGRSTILLLDRPEMFVSKRGAPIASHHARLNLTLYTHADYRSLVPQAPSVRGCQRARGGQSHTAATAGLRPPEQARGRLAVHACLLRLEPI